MHAMLLSGAAGRLCMRGLESEPDELLWGKCNASNGGTALFIRKAMHRLASFVSRRAD